MKTTAICIILIPLFLISLAVTAVSTDEQLMENFLEKHSKNFEKAFPATQQLYDYFEDDAEMPTDFNEKEASHLQNVKFVLKGFKWIFLLLFLLLIFLIPFSISQTHFLP